jgi:23S rRNA maturation-related 3'-5' exoribonuclease YhaM
MPLNTNFHFNQCVDTKPNEIVVCDLLSLIKRHGIESLVDYLLTSDYFTAPASTRYHNVFEGGLCQHSLNVTREFSKENVLWKTPLPQDSVIICGLLHDLCKVGAYTETARGYETVKDQPKGHGRLSVSRVSQFIELTEHERNIIHCHMGLYSVYIYKEFSAWDLHKATIKTPQCQLFAAIDLSDSRKKGGI